MRVYRRMLYRSAACLIGAALLFAACEKSDNNTEGLDIADSSTRCLLQPPTIGVMPFGAGSPATRAAQAIKEEQQAFNVGEELGNIITLGNSPVEETSQTRTLNAGAYCRVVVYKLEDWNNGTMKILEQRLCKQGSTDYFADLGDSTEPIYLYPGDYKIFCYSFNKTTTEKMTPLADDAANVPLSDGDDFMSVVIDKTITVAQVGTSVSLGTVTLEHRCCQLIGILKAEGFENGTGIATSPAPTLSATSTFTTAGNWSITGTRFEETTIANSTKAFTMTKSGNDYKGTIVILPLTSKALSANYNFKANGSNVTATASNKSVNAGISFNSGGSYSFTIKAIGAYVITSGVESILIAGDTWATRNVRWDNQFETNCNIWESGNLRGVSQVTTSNIGQTSEYNSYFMWGNNTAFVSGGSYNTGTDDWSLSTNPCPSGYKVPDKAQLTNLITKKIPQGSKMFIDGETFIINNKYGFYDGKNAKGLVLLDSDNVLFLPAAGACDSMTGWLGVGSQGSYWAGTLEDGKYTRMLFFHNATCMIFTGADHNLGQQVRCVKLKV